MATSSNRGGEQLEDPHAELRRSAHDDVILQLQAAAAQGLQPGQFVVGIFDEDDPNTPDELMKEMNRDGFTAQVLKLDVFVAAMKQMAMPADSSILWSAKRRRWVDGNGKPKAPGFAVHFPFAGHAEELQKPIQPGEFVVATFVGGEIEVFRAHLDYLGDEPPTG